MLLSLLADGEIFFVRDGHLATGCLADQLRRAHRVRGSAFFWTQFFFNFIIKTKTYLI